VYRSWTGESHKAWRARIDAFASFVAQAAENRASSTSLHIVEHLGGRSWSQWYRCRRPYRRFSWAPITYEAMEYDHDVQTPQIALSEFFLMRGVVRFSTSCGYDLRRLAQLASTIHYCIRYSYPLSPQTPQMRSGRLYLCGVPALVLSPEELIAAGDKANDIAKLKVFDAISALVINFGPRTTWEAYNSRIHFVNPGFRPTLADLMED
jgi:hypothetical protein